MKKLILLLLVMVTLTTLTIPLAGAAKSGSDVEVSLQRYDPFPAEPGSYTDVYLLVTNKRELAENLEIEFIPKHPLTLAPGEQKKKFIGNLDALQENYAVVQYRVNVAPDAINKDYNFTVFHSYGDGRAKVKWEFPLTVKGTDASITLESYEFSPKEIKPGQTANLTLMLKNTGQGTVKDIDVTLNFADTNIVTLDSGTTKRIARLKPKETTSLKYSLIVDGSTQVKVLDIPVDLKFRDSLNSNYNKTTNLGMVIKAGPKLSIRLDDTTITKQGTVGDVSVQVVNSGIVDVRYVTLKLIESEEYDILSYSNDVYIGNLDSDDFEIADFKIRAKTKQPKLQFKLEYKDPYNKDYDEAVNLPLRIISSKELGEESNGYATILIILIVVAGAGFWYYRRRKKRKQLAHHKHHKKKK